MKKHIYKIMAAALLLVTCGACDKEWQKEQYLHWVSLKAPINSGGITATYMRYNPDGKVTYQLPIIVSGSTMNEQDLNVKIVVDPDTLNTLNTERFSTRKELYYVPLEESRYSFPETATVKKDTCYGLLPITFDLKGLDLVDKWVLPLTIVNGDNYVANPRKQYRKAILRIFPFNDYSGEYGATAYKTYFKGNETEAIAGDYKTAYVVDENTVFFYAGTLDEDELERGLYKVYFEFTDEKMGEGSIEKKVRIYGDNSKNKLKVIGQPTYFTDVIPDATRPYIEHHYVTVSLEYEYTDYTSVDGYELDYVVKGDLVMQRTINTQIPDEDQAIEW